MYAMYRNIVYENNTHITYVAVVPWQRVRVLRPRIQVTGRLLLLLCALKLSASRPQGYLWSWLLAGVEHPPQLTALISIDHACRVTVNKACHCASQWR